jgi:hypothetical protein
LSLPARSTADRTDAAPVVLDRLYCGNSPIKAQADRQKQGDNEKGDGGQRDRQQSGPAY